MNLTGLEQLLLGATIGAVSSAGGLLLGLRNRVNTTVCIAAREKCQTGIFGEIKGTKEGLNMVTNYIRYEMQKDGLSLGEINRILREWQEGK